MNKTTIDWLIRYEEIKASQEMNGELLVAKGEYAWVRVHAARKNIIELQVHCTVPSYRVTYKECDWKYDWKLFK